MTVSAADLKVTFTADTKDAEKGIKRVDDGLKGFVKRASSVGVGVLGAMAFRGIARGFMNGAAGALDFGAQMANVNSIAQLTDDALARVSDSVMAIAANPAITQAPAELASGLYDVYSSGFQGADALNVLEKSALAATAGITTTATAARAITSVINAFGLTAGDAGHVSDVLFQTVNDGVITFEQLANNLGNVIPIANSLGLGIEDVGAAYAQMTLKGVNASAAETQIASLMRSALNPTDALTTAVQAHGYASAEAAIRTEGLSGFLKILNDASGGSETALMDLLGTQEAMNAATILGADGVKDYVKELNKMKHSSDGAGATNKALEKQMKSASFAIAKMKQTVQQLAVVGFGILAPVITKAAGAMTSFLSKGVIPFTKIIGSALKGGFAFDKMIKQLPQPLRRAAHALGSIAEAAGDMWRHGFSKNEMLQALHGVQALGDELGQGIHWVFNAVIDAAVSLGSLLLDGVKAAPGAIWDWIKGKIMGTGPVGDATGGPSPVNMNSIDFGTVAITAAVRLGGAIANLAGHLWDWVKGQLIGGAGSVSQDPASSMYGQAGQSIDMGSWTLNVAAPAIASAVGDLGAWVNRYLFNQTNNQSVGPVAWQLHLSLPSIEMPAAFASGQQAGEYIRGKLGVIAANDVSWKLALAAPLVLLFGGPAAIGGLIVKKLTGIGPVELVKWTLTVLAPSTVAFGIGVALGLIPGAIRTALDAAGVAIKGFTAWTLNVGTAATFAVAWTAEQIASKVKTTIGVIPDIRLPVKFIVDLSVDVITNVDKGASAIWDFLTGHITPLSIGGMPGGGPGGGAGASYDISQNLNVTASLDLNAWNSAIAQVKTDVDAYNGTLFTAFFGIDLVQAIKAYTDAFTWGTAWGNATFTSTFDADDGPASVKYSDVSMWGAAWDAAIFASAFDIDLGPAAIEYTNAWAMGNAWSGAVFSASFAIDVSGLYYAQAVAYQVAANIAAVMPHSPAKRGPLSKPISFSFIADAAHRDLSGLGSTIEGYLGANGRRRIGARGPRGLGGRPIVVNALKSSELLHLIRGAEKAHDIAGLGHELGMSYGV